MDRSVRAVLSCLEEHRATWIGRGSLLRRWRRTDPAKQLWRQVPTYRVGVGIRSARPTFKPFAVQGFIAWTVLRDTPK